MPGIFGIPAIPTAAEMTAMGIAVEDHGAAQAAALIDHARQQLVQPLLDAIASLPAQAGKELNDAVNAAINRLNNTTLDNAAGVPLVKLTIP